MSDRRARRSKDGKSRRRPKDGKSRRKRDETNEQRAKRKQRERAESDAQARAAEAERLRAAAAAEEEEEEEEDYGFDDFDDDDGASSDDPAPSAQRSISVASTSAKPMVLSMPRTVVDDTDASRRSTYALTPAAGSGASDASSHGESVSRRRSPQQQISPSRAEHRVEHLAVLRARLGEVAQPECFQTAPLNGQDNQLRRLAARAIKSVHTATRDDASVRTQTDAPPTRSVGAQAPEDAGFGPGSVLFGGALSRSSSAATPGSVAAGAGSGGVGSGGDRLFHFLRAASGVVESLLDENWRHFNNGEGSSRAAEQSAADSSSLTAVRAVVDLGKWVVPAEVPTLSALRSHAIASPRGKRSVPASKNVRPDLESSRPCSVEFGSADTHGAGFIVLLAATTVDSTMRGEMGAHASGSVRCWRLDVGALQGAAALDGSITQPSTATLVPEVSLQLRGGAQPSCCCSLGKRAEFVVAGTTDGDVVLWDLDEDERLHRSFRSSQHSGYIYIISLFIMNGFFSNVYSIIIVVIIIIGVART